MRSASKSAAERLGRRDLQILAFVTRTISRVIACPTPHQNPVMKKLVTNASEYLYCSASPCRLSVHQTSRLQPLVAAGLEFRAAVFLPTSSLSLRKRESSTQGGFLLLGSRVTITK